MAEVLFKCPQCGKEASQEKIISNNYSCVNPKCSLNVRLLVHGEVTTTGNLSKVYGWVLQPGAALGKKYEIVNMIGKGGYGATYLARDHSMFDQLRAIKEVPRTFCDDKEDEFLTLLNHPAIPRLYERFNHGQFHYSVMDFVEGESLEQIVKRRAGGLDEKELLNLARQIFDVLIYIHSKKIVHRDLKPDNILVRKNGTIALIDFGIAKQHRAGIGTRHLARAASYCYSSPEQYQAGKGFTDFKSDIYSLGAILYFMAIGIEPPDALSRDASRDISPLPRSLNPKISKALEKVIITATKMNKSARYKNIREMKAALFGKGVTTQKATCPKCKAPLQPGDKFCSKCGSSTHPVQQSILQPFVFRSGKKAHTIQQFIGLCYQNWSETVTYLYSGKIETWLKKIPDGTALAQQAVRIRKKYHNKHAGLNQFLLASGFGKQPNLSVIPSRIEISKDDIRKKQSPAIYLSNAGAGLLSGTIESSASWISPVQSSFSCVNRNRVQAQLNINLDSKMKRQELSSDIIIKSNGGIIKIPFVYSPASQKETVDKMKPAKKNQFFRFVTPIFIFILVMITVRYLGPSARLTVAHPKVIGFFGLFVAAMNLHYGKFGALLGFIMGACAGAGMEVLAYFVYPIVNSYLIHPIIENFTAKASAEINFAGWGILGAYIGGTFVLFSRKK